MRQTDYLNEFLIRKTISTLKPDNELFEVRILTSTKKSILSGYFRDADTLIKAFDTVDVRDANIYITLNKVKDELYSRLQHDRFLSVKQTTSDNEISYYEWLFIDLDPVRPSGISSSDAELKAAEKLAGKVYHYLKELGFSEPVKALSGNGCHLLYGIYLENTEANRNLIERCLKALAESFDNDQVKIDTTNYNPARICKLHGTLAQKGANTEERPHRLSKIFFAADVITKTRKVYLQKLADSVPERMIAPASYKSQEFDLLRFMDENSLTYSKTSTARDSTVYHLDECPFNHSHKDGDAKIFHYTNGAIAFKCHHNSCSQYTWQDVRQKFDPDCYNKPNYPDEDKRIDEGWKQHNRNKSSDELNYDRPVIKDDIELFRTAKMIAEDIEPEKEYVMTGITDIDKKMRGLAKKEISVISGLRSSGKSTLIGQIMLNAVEADHTVICYSGELNNKTYLEWLTRQAAGYNNIEESKKFENIYFVPVTKKKMIYEWMGDKFWLYNNKCGNRFTEILAILRTVIIAHKADLCVIDNLMIMDLSGTPGDDKYDQQKQFVLNLKQLAEDTNCHVIFVAHPRKSVQFLRIEDISGSGDIANIVDNAFIVHRVNNDFQKRFTEAFGAATANMILTAGANNIVEIAKDRENGTQDYFINLYFDVKSKRLLNQITENVIYSWDPANRGEFRQADEFDEIPF